MRFWAWPSPSEHSVQRIFWIILQKCFYFARKKKKQIAFLPTSSCLKTKSQQLSVRLIFCDSVATWLQDPSSTSLLFTFLWVALLAVITSSISEFCSPRTEALQPPITANSHDLTKRRCFWYLMKVTGASFWPTVFPLAEEIWAEELIGQKHWENSGKCKISWVPVKAQPAPLPEQDILLQLSAQFSCRRLIRKLDVHSLSE